MTDVLDEKGEEDLTKLIAAHLAYLIKEHDNGELSYHGLHVRPLRPNAPYLVLDSPRCHYVVTVMKTPRPNEKTVTIDGTIQVQVYTDEDGKRCIGNINYPSFADVKRAVIEKDKEEP